MKDHQYVTLLVKFADEINKLLLLPKKQRAKLVLFLGAGMSKLSTIRHRKTIYDSEHVKKCIGCENTTEEYEKQRAVWSEYDYNRLYSRNVIPDISYYFVARLCAAGVVRSILTTNYDSFLWSIFTRDNNLPQPAINPVLRSGEVDTSGYRSPKRTKKLRIYYLHGAFDWAQFKTCQCLVKLPPYAVGTTLWRVDKGWGGVFFHDYHADHGPRPTGPAQHFVDWNMDEGNRDPFAREIEAAKGEINWAVRRGGRLLLLGFIGTHCHPRLPSWHEEMAEPLAAAAQEIPTCMVITRDQEKSFSSPEVDGPTIAESQWLWSQLNLARWGETNVVPEIGDWFLAYLKGSRLNPRDIEREYYRRWWYSPLFITVRAFEGEK